MFPSTRISQQLLGSPMPTNSLDSLDQPVWQLLATIAVQANVEQHQVLVTLLREKILENVVSANAAWTSEETRQLKLANISKFYRFITHCMANWISRHFSSCIGA